MKYAVRFAFSGFRSLSTLTAKEPDIINGPSGLVWFDVIENICPVISSGALIRNCGCTGAGVTMLWYFAVTTMSWFDPSSGIVTSPAPPKGV